MLEVYSLNQAEQWDMVVRSFTEYDVFWLSGYVKAFHIHGDGTPLLFYFEDEKTRGINVVMKRDVADDELFKNRIAEGVYFDFATPYGYGGWIIEGEETGTLFYEYQKWLEKHDIISEFVRFHPMIRNHEKNRSFYEVVQLGKVIHMDLSSPEDIWANITSKNRNMIRKAVKNGIVIYNGQFPEIYKTFQKVYNETMAKDQAQEYYYFEPDFYASMLKDLPYNAQVFWAEYEGKVIAASSILAANGKMSYHLSGTLAEFRPLAPTNLLLYHAAIWGYTHGFKTFYLGGGVGSCEDSLYKFKRSFFKGELNSFFIGKKIYNPQKYEELTEMRGIVDNPRYFPRYRG